MTPSTLAFDLAEKQQLICNGLKSTLEFTFVSKECASYTLAFK